MRAGRFLKGILEGEGKGKGKGEGGGERRNELMAAGRGAAKGKCRYR